MQQLKAMQNKQYENLVRVKSQVEQEVRECENRIQVVGTLQKESHSQLFIQDYQQFAKKTQKRVLEIIINEDIGHFDK